MSTVIVLLIVLYMILVLFVLMLGLHYNQMLEHQLAELANRCNKLTKLLLKYMENNDEK